MRRFDNCNPVAVAVYFLATASIAMFCTNPILLLLSLLGSVVFFIARNGLKHLKSHFAFVGMFLAMALINPLVSHNGTTVLFVMNDSPITLEAIVYGFITAGMVIAVLYWFRSFTQIMTSDKLLYVFGKVSPKAALVLSMGLRYVPLFGRQSKRINAAQTALGLYREDNIVDRIRGGIRVFSVLLTWALENGIVTADSMAARGYGIGKRTHFSVFRFCSADYVLMLLTLVLGTTACISLGTGAFEFTCYPNIKFAKLSPMSLAGFISYGILAFIPTIAELEERIKWKYLKSKI